jgi:hypothetical protein
MEIVIAGGVVAVGLVIAAALLAKRTPAPSVAGGQAKASPARVAPDAAAGAEATRIEERLKGREQAVETRAAEIAERERRLAEKEGQITQRRARSPSSASRRSASSSARPGCPPRRRRRC